MNGVLWVIACNVAALAVLALGKRSPAKPSIGQPRASVAISLSVVGLVGCAVLGLAEASP